MRQIYNVLLIGLICTTLFSCDKNDTRIKSYYPSGNIREIKNYNNDSKLISSFIYYDSTDTLKQKEAFYLANYDSVIYYYKNGNIFKFGNKSKDDLSFGKWKYYTKEGHLSTSKEFLIINNSWSTGSWLNQVVYYNIKGDTMFYGNNKFNIYNQKEFQKESEGDKTSIFVRFHNNVNDTINISEPYSGIAEDGFPFWEKKDSESYLVLAKEKYNFNKDFSNEKEVKLDTFWCLAKDKINKDAIPNANQKHTVIFGRWFKTPGKKILRGYMVEHYKRKAIQNDSIIGEKRRTYFEKVIYVKDTTKF